MDPIDIFENRDSLVPVIGENCFFYGEGESQRPLHDFVIEKMIEKYLCL